MTLVRKSAKDGNAKAAASDILQICGKLTDARVAAILAIGATIEQVEEAAAWASGESDVMGQLRRPVSGPVAEIFDVLTADELYGEDRD